jgi:hypothetical protein
MKYKLPIYLLTACLLGYGAYKLTVKTADKFILSEIQYDRPNDPLFDTRPLTAEETREVDQALSQDYTYFGCGGQAYVFFSADGNYVIKFFKQRHFREPKHLDYIPFIKRYRDVKYGKRKQKMRQEYGSYKIGFEQLPRESALVYLHLNKTDHLHKSITFVDKFNLPHTIDLDKTDFILQRRAELVHDKIASLMRKGDVEGAKKTVSMIVDLIVTRCKKGYFDKDPNIRTNCGILDDHAIKIDVGRFSQDLRMKKPIFYKTELSRQTRPFLQWLGENYPELARHLEQEVFQVIAHE